MMECTWPKCLCPKKDHCKFSGFQPCNHLQAMSKLIPMTTKEKREELIKRFGDKFYNELGDRIANGQRMQGGKILKMDDNALKLADLATDALYKEWIEDANPPADIS